MLLEVHRQDLVEGQLVGVVDHAGEAELPIGRVDLRHGQGRIDPVEVVVGRQVARDPADLVERVQRTDLGGDRGSGRGGCGRFGRSCSTCGRCSGGRSGRTQVDSGSGGLCRRGAAHPPTQRNEAHGCHAGAADAEQEGPAARVSSAFGNPRGHRLRWLEIAIVGSCRTVSGREPQQHPQRDVAECGGGDGHGPRAHERAHRVAGGSPAADDAECGESRNRHPATPRCHRARTQQAADDQRHADDADGQHRFVLLTEQLDAQLHGPVGRVVDQRLADGDDQ